jgi:hypothetical protein
LKKVHDLLYKARGFKITMTHADEEFMSLRHPLLELDSIRLNIAATNEHVPEIERGIRTIKEQNRSTVSGLPYKHYPMILMKALVSHTVSWLNMFPHADGVSETMSSQTILTGVTPITPSTVEFPSVHTVKYTTKTTPVTQRSSVPRLPSP